MKTFICGADMGCIKIMSKDMSCFFDNGFGDGDFKVFVYETEDEKKSDELNNDFEFLQHFTIRQDNKCFLMLFDCSEFIKSDKLYCFSKGRWFVYLDKKKGQLHIAKEDGDTHS